MNDAHCHFFSRQFFETLGRQRQSGARSAEQITAERGWAAPGSPEELADVWVGELDRNGVARASLIASVPQDEASVETAVGRHRSRFVGFFMLDPTQPDAPRRQAQADAAQRLKRPKRAADVVQLDQMIHSGCCRS